MRFLASIPLVAVISASALDAQTVSGVVFADRNGNGVRDAGEPGIASVVVSDQDTVVLTNTAGAYTLRVKPQSAGMTRSQGLVFVSVPDGYRAAGSFWRKRSDGLAFPLVPAPQPTGGSFTFLHASDTHVSPQSIGRTQHLRAMSDSLHPDFVIVTGDLVRDALRVGENEARGYYDLFAVERRAFKAPVYSVPGNHEMFGIETHQSHVSPTHPLFARGMYHEYFGPDYYSFTYGGVHFVGLNTIDIEGEWYYGHVDSLQLAWLARDIAAIPADMPVVTFDHIPFYTTGEQLNGYMADGPAPSLITVNGVQQFRHSVSNAREVLAVLGTRRRVLALGGHMHFAEYIERPGENVRYALSAATVGPSDNLPSGFTIYTVRGGDIDSGRFIRLDPLPSP
jgi:Icc protein